jgi:transcriptional regulator with XRE-family HTH domain
MGDLNSELTELLRDMRHQAGLTQSELSQRLGWASHYKGAGYGCPQVSKYEHGVKVPKWDVLGRWAAACGFHAELVITRPGAGRWVVPLNDGPNP